MKEVCHVNSNEDGDRFVGIKIDDKKVGVFFPIGYNLPEEDSELRKDIFHLILVLAEFTTKEDRLLSMNKYDSSLPVEFPINAYRIIVESFLTNGCNYYVEKDPVYKTGVVGKKDWAKTIKKHNPLIQTINDTSSLVFTKFVSMLRKE